MSAAVLLAACAVEPSADTAPGAASAGETTLTFAWWGSDVRHEVTRQALDRFMAAHPQVTVVGDYTDWGSYWDKLATTVTADDTPDVLTQEERYLREYASRGVLADLSALPVDTSLIDPGVLAAGQMEGGLYGIPTGINAYAVVADPAVFAEAGVDLPDDETWTWRDYVDIAAEISANHPGGAVGAQDYGFNEAGFTVFARQRGESLYAQDGSLGFTAPTLAAWWEISLELRDSGATPPASVSVEVDAGGPEQSLVGTGRGAMAFFWTNQLGAIQRAAGRDLVLLRHPGETEHERTGMYVKPAMLYSVAARSDHQEAAAQLVDYLLNDVEAAEVLRSDRGLPANTEVRAAVQGTFEEADQEAAAFLAGLEDEILDPVPVPPVGAGEVVEILRRVNAEVLFDRLSPSEAAERFIAEVEGALS